MRIAPLVLVLGAAALSVPRQTAAEEPLPVPYVAQPTAVTCVPAAAVMALAAQGLPLDMGDLARSLPVQADGVAILDLQDALAARGGHAFIGRGDVRLLDALVAAGVPPVVLVDAHAKHALVIAGREPGGWAVRDPARPDVRSLTDAALAARWEATGRQLLVVAARSLGALPADLLAPLLATDRRYRATELLLRARAHGAPNDQAMSLYDRALAEDPGFAALHTDVGIAWCRRGDRSRALLHLTRAAALLPHDEATRRNLERVRSRAAACGNAAPRQAEFEAAPVTMP